MSAAAPTHGAVAFLRVACSGPIVKIALQTSLFVGTILNAINNGPRLLRDPSELSWASVALNYAVPYLVSSYSAARSALRAAP